MVSACARRQQVAYASTRGLSQRRACALLRTARSGLRYESRKAAKDAVALTRMAELARQYPRYGYRRIRDSLDGALAVALEGLLSRAEVRATARRADALLASCRFPFPSPDWPAIPWPPF